ncbi:MAG: copper resistance protein CopC [Caldilineaceae bacterium]
MSTKLKQVAKVIFLGMLLLFVQADYVHAHALLTRSLPEAGAELATAPASIELWFSEPLETKFSNAHIEDAQGNQLGNGESQVDANDLTHMTLHVSGLAPGVYTVVYRSLSQADGHEWLGSFPLVILNADGSRPAGAEAVHKADTAQQELLPGFGAVVSRWLSLLGSMLLVGVLLLKQIANLRPTSSVVPGKPLAKTAKFQAVLRRSITLGINTGMVMLGLGVVSQIVVMSSALNENNGLTELLLQTNSGKLLCVRLLLAGAWLAIVLVWGKGQNLVIEWPLFALSLAILATFSLGSHAAAVVGSGWAMLVDFVHLGAAAIWLGGLTLLALLLWNLRGQPAKEDGIALRQTVQRFSAVATLAVFVLACSGLFSTLVQLKSLDLLWTSLYGWVLLAKLALMAFTLVIALLNHRLVRDSASDSASAWQSSQYRSFLRQVWSESLLGLVLMLVVAVLVQTPIPQLASTSEAKDYFETILTADDLNIHMQILPNQVGENQYITHLYHTDGSSIGEVQMVRLSFEHQTAQLGQSDLVLNDQGNGILNGKGAYLNRAGPWNVSVYIRRRGMDDTLVKTSVEVPDANAQSADSQVTPSRQPWQNPITTVPAIVLIGAVLLACFVVFLLFRRIEKNA